MPQPLFGPAEFGFEPVEASAAEVLHLYVLEPVPNAFVRVQIRSVARQLLQMEALGSPLGEKRSDLRSPMGG